MRAAECWGRVSVAKDQNGHLEAILENSDIRIRYGLQYHEEGPESNITELVVKSAPEVNQAGHLVDAAAGRGPLARASVACDGPDVKTLRLEWSGKEGRPDAISEVSIYEDSAFVRIDYIAWVVNIVDIGHPGGAVTDAVYEIHGASAWKRDLVLYPNSYFNRHPGDVGQENVTEVDDVGPLAYAGCFVMGVYNPANGIGFGRVVPADVVDIIKLLEFNGIGKGFELFPHYEREHRPFTGYLYLVTGGAEELLLMGQELATGKRTGHGSGGTTATLSRTSG
jgi:hypothetical protein